MSPEDKPDIALSRVLSLPWAHEWTYRQRATESLKLMFMRLSFEGREMLSYLLNNRLRRFHNSLIIRLLTNKSTPCDTR